VRRLWGDGARAQFGCDAQKVHRRLEHQNTFLMNTEELALKHATAALRDIMESIRKEGAIDWRAIIKKHMMFLAGEILKSYGKPGP